MTQPVFETTATALREKSKLRRHFRGGSGSPATVFGLIP
jgi:hypothetical protein